MYSAIKIILFVLFPLIYGYQNLPNVDVAIVGAGLSGLSTAKDLAKAGRSFVIFEARDRVGGRVLNNQLPNKGIVEVGAQFVGPTQDRVLDLAQSLGLSTFKTFNSGNTTLFHNGTRSVFNGTFTTGDVPISPEGLTQAGRALLLLDTMATKLDVDAPWNHSQSIDWDSETVPSWLNREAPHPDAQFLLTQAAAGNATTRGTFERLIDVAGGAQEQRIVGGTQLLAIRLAERVGLSNIIFNAPVRNIELKDETYLVSSNNQSVIAKHVVVAMSPPLASRITYQPLLPAARDHLTQRMPMGSIGKAFAAYATPFWREAGLNGQVVSDTGAVRITFDSSPDDGSFGIMMGFIEADEMRRLDRLPEREITEEITKDLVRYFGPRAANVQNWVIQRWDLEQFSRGGPVAYAPPGVLTAYGTSLKSPHGRLHFAGTEASSFWVGFMDGAIRSGERVATEILMEL
ncbi:Flavin containing amine oxidoreductase [Aspergillus parasiticus SU-1]|uniref:Amine oxidase n=1 Tax=Aspergillus parasiticus (strain ATCC 56775 / NRRL 5862 / SRRC 143 / SU-1) TaxID=1403190 RepID=A0A0F0II44_ASPPU|nr:Flavin containing amine oxidoreductase [Aspergillus parasiticus SU-1]